MNRHEHIVQPVLQDIDLGVCRVCGRSAGSSIRKSVPDIKGGNWTKDYYCPVHYETAKKHLASFVEANAKYVLWNELGREAGKE